MSEGRRKCDRVPKIGAKLQELKVWWHRKGSVEPGTQFEVGDGRGDFGRFVVPSP